MDAVTHYEFVTTHKNSTYLRYKMNNIIDNLFSSLIRRTDQWSVRAGWPE